MTALAALQRILGQVRFAEIVSDGPKLIVFCPAELVAELTERIRAAGITDVDVNAHPWVSGGACVVDRQTPPHAASVFLDCDRPSLWERAQRLHALRVENRW